MGYVVSLEARSCDMMGFPSSFNITHSAVSQLSITTCMCHALWIVKCSPSALNPFFLTLDWEQDSLERHLTEERGHVHILNKKIIVCVVDRPLGESGVPRFVAQMLSAQNTLFSPVLGILKSPSSSEPSCKIQCLPRVLTDL